MVYIDPNGEWILVVGGAISGAIGGYASGGGLGGALGGAVGGAIAGLIPGGAFVTNFFASLIGQGIGNAAACRSVSNVNLTLAFTSSIAGGGAFKYTRYISRRGANKRFGGEMTKNQETIISSILEGGATGSVGLIPNGSPNTNNCGC